MPIVEITDKKKIHALLVEDPIGALEAIDENALGVEGIVSVFAADEDAPVNLVAVRWGQKNLGLGSLAVLRAGRLTGLEDVVAAVPIDRGQYEMLLPFWASPAIGSAFETDVLGAEATYMVDRARFRRSPAARQCVRLDDPEIIKPMFPKLAADAPAYVLALKGALTSVAAVTHLREDVARIRVYTIETSRRHGFGRAVLCALAEELIALGVVPTLAIDLGDESAVRMVEGAGFFQKSASIKALIRGRRAAAPPQPAPTPLVQLGGGIGRR